MAERVKVFIDGKEQNINALDLLSSLLKQKTRRITTDGDKITE